MTTSITFKTEVIELPHKIPEKPPTDTKFVISLILPAIVLLIIAVLIPIVLGIFISFTDSSGKTGYFGSRIGDITSFYEILFKGKRDSKIFWQYTYQTLFFSIVSLSIEFILGLIFAFILNKNFKGRGLARATLLIPWAIPTVASATIFRYEIFAPASEYGLVNSLLALFNFETVHFYGVDADILFNLPVLVPFAPFITEVEIKMTMITAIMIDVWKTTPFITLLILASLQIVPEDLYKAGDIAGTSGWQKFRYISWPLIKPGVGIAIIFRMMQALRVYDAIVVFQDNSVNSMTSQAVSFWLSTDWSYASTVAVLLFALIIIFALFLLYFTRRRETGGVTEVKELTLEKEETYNVDQFLSSTNISFETRLTPPSQRKINWFKRKIYLRKIGFYLLVVFMCIFCALPFIWIVLRSFRYPYLDMRQDSFEIIPKIFSIESYKLLFQNSRFTGVSFEKALTNSFIVSSLTVLVVIVFGSFIAYAIARFKFRGKKILNSFIFSMNSLPALIIIIPFFIQITAINNLLPFLDLKDNIYTLVIPYAAINLPLGVFVLTAFFNEIPEELWSAAKVDGASNFKIFRKIILPLTIPGIFTTAILVFIASWNELLFAQIFLTSDSNHTVPRAILRFVQNDLSLQASWDTTLTLLAATTLSTVPLVVVVLIFQKKIVSGLTRGAVKG
ncbi:MAG: ABC transporter permease subunit [Candidatus Thorarchaeota archaeon]